MTTSSDIAAGQIWLTYLHFIDYPEIGKVRPVLIVNNNINEATAVVVKITSKPPRKDSGDIAITDWKSAGLKTPSCARVDYLFRIAHAEPLRDAPLGKVSDKTLLSALRGIANKNNQS